MTSWERTNKLQQKCLKFLTGTSGIGLNCFEFIYRLGCNTLEIQYKF